MIDSIQSQPALPYPCEIFPKTRETPTSTDRKTEILAGNVFQTMQISDFSKPTILMIPFIKKDGSKKLYQVELQSCKGQKNIEEILKNTIIKYLAETVHTEPGKTYEIQLPPSMENPDTAWNIVYPQNTDEQPTVRKVSFSNFSEEEKGHIEQLREIFHPRLQKTPSLINQNSFPIVDQTETAKTIDETTAVAGPSPFLLPPPTRKTPEPPSTFCHQQSKQTKDGNIETPKLSDMRASTTASRSSQNTEPVIRIPPPPPSTLKRGKILASAESSAVSPHPFETKESKTTDIAIKSLLGVQKKQKPITLQKTPDLISFPSDTRTAEEILGLKTTISQIQPKLSLEQLLTPESVLKEKKEKMIKKFIQDSKKDLAKALTYLQKEIDLDGRFMKDDFLILMTEQDIKLIKVYFKSIIEKIKDPYDFSFNKHVFIKLHDELADLGFPDATKLKERITKTEQKLIDQENHKISILNNILGLIQKESFIKEKMHKLKKNKKNQNPNNFKSIKKEIQTVIRDEISGNEYLFKNGFDSNWDLFNGSLEKAIENMHERLNEVCTILTPEEQEVVKTQASLDLIKHIRQKLIEKSKTEKMLRPIRINSAQDCVDEIMRINDRNKNIVLDRLPSQKKR